MDKLKEKINILRSEADAAIARADQTETELKRAEIALASKGTQPPLYPYCFL